MESSDSYDKTPKYCKLFIGGFPFDSNPIELQSRLEKIVGSTVKFDLQVDQRTGKSKGIAFVDVPSAEAADLCIKTYNKTAWKGYRLRVEKAKEYYLDRLKREWLDRDKESKRYSEVSNETISSESENRIENTVRKPVRLKKKYRILRIKQMDGRIIKIDTKPEVAKSLASVILKRNHRFFWVI